MSETPLEQDARRLKALAHPVRVRLLSLLANDGPSRTADLAAALDEPPNSVSFHLRMLEKYGMARRVPNPEGEQTPGARRESWWKAVSRSALIHPSQWEGEHREAALSQLQALMTMSARDGVEGVMAAYEHRDQFPDEAAGAVGRRRYTVRLTPEEAADAVERMRAIGAELIAKADRERPEGSLLWHISVESFPELRFPT